MCDENGQCLAAQAQTDQFRAEFYDRCRELSNAARAEVGWEPLTPWEFEQMRPMLQIAGAAMQYTLQSWGFIGLEEG